MKFRFIPCKNFFFIANATLIHTKEKPYQSQSTLKQNKLETFVSASRHWYTGEFSTMSVIVFVDAQLANLRAVVF